MRCGAFGDIVLLTVLLRRLHERFGQPVDVIASGAWSRPLLESQPGVGEVVLLGSRKAPYWSSPGQWQLVRWLRARPLGPVWYCDSGAGRDLLRRAGIADAQVCDAAQLHPVAGEHTVERWTRFAACTPVAYVSALPPASSAAVSDASLSVSAASRVALASWLRQRGLDHGRLILIQAGNKRTMRVGSRRRASNSKYWPEQNWASVLRAIRQRHKQHAIVLLGVRAESALNQNILHLAGISDAHDCAGDVPVPMLLPLLEQATGMISVDTGPAHAAAALGCPTVVLFGQADPKLYRAGGLNTPVVSLCGSVDGQTSMLGITANDVITAWGQIIEVTRRNPSQNLTIAS
jgi:heptosyltransferase-2/heptosyltransferase-3